ncbi:Transient receptor potential cation channel subfamily M member 6 [Exaiptasia diaphana]|nr:Transient receptor potential cation channel subfamily M member 6 [Exaiptasia diaphana]
MQKRQQAWNRLRENVGAKRTRHEARKSSKGSHSIPHEIIVQRLASEPDNKQTYKPIQPREFVNYEYDEFTLANLKKACGEHFNFPPSTCDILVSNKGPSCTNILQIPHRKDKVYLVRFVVVKELNDVGIESDEESGKEQEISSTKSINNSTEKSSSQSRQSVFPPSVSIASLLKAGSLIKPTQKRKVSLSLERFDLQTQKWLYAHEEEVIVHLEKFASGAFRDAFHATSCRSSKQWVVKTYLPATVKIIEEELNTTVEDHCRKHVQMHAVARHLTQRFKSKAPKKFGNCFHYNECFFTTYEGKAATIEDFVPGTFAKLINNDGELVKIPGDASDEVKELNAKAECLVHFSHSFTEGKIMLTDIQGSSYHLYDPEISSENITSEETGELNFCCGNCTSIGIKNFMQSHKCNEFCQMMGLKYNSKESTCI